VEKKMKITVDTGLVLRYYQNIEGDSMDRLVIKDVTINVGDVIRLNTDSPFAFNDSLVRKIEVIDKDGLVLIHLARPYCYVTESGNVLTGFENFAIYGGSISNYTIVINDGSRRT